MRIKCFETKNNVIMHKSLTAWDVNEGHKGGKVSKREGTARLKNTGYQYWVGCNKLNKRWASLQFDLRWTGIQTTHTMGCVGDLQVSSGLNFDASVMLRVSLWQADLIFKSMCLEYVMKSWSNLFLCIRRPCDRTAWTALGSTQINTGTWVVIAYPAEWTGLKESSQWSGL